ncbi:MAG: AbrB/MazE/SpoVT family DNA-binding domain-containing protein [Candidatus Heimdallarchaeota archaeon]
MTILATAKVSKGFRVTIPKEARELLELEEDDEIVFFTVEGLLGRVCFRKASSK